MPFRAVSILVVPEKIFNVGFLINASTSGCNYNFGDFVNEMSIPVESTSLEGSQGTESSSPGSGGLKAETDLKVL
uniref:Uncharacterized protein n=1 Tax=Amphimedon queenslandica TaxID=400682 RepID=A0A1X7T8E2_AMPQE